MDIEPIETNTDYRAALNEIETLRLTAPDKPEGEKLDAMVTLIEANEAKHFAMELPDAFETIKLEMVHKSLGISAAPLIKPPHAL